jgi:ribonucleoside-diphosphate reductase alpha chain
MEEQSETTSLVVQNSNGCGGRGLVFRRFFTKSGSDPLDEIEWEVRTASIQTEKGEAIFEQSNVEVPKDWSQTATNIVASKYFHGKVGTPERESSVKQLTLVSLTQLPTGAKKAAIFATTRTPGSSMTS